MMYGPKKQSESENLKLVLIEKTIQMSGYPVTTITALLADLDEKDKAAIQSSNPFRLKAGLMSHPMLIRGSIVEGERGDYDIEVLAHQLGAKRVKEEEYLRG
ncbi:MAG: hypothetical protein J6I65_03840 [Lachnospiraceae bacterium]|nr:hypothetical protein [Lachnospiraceae bacterium]